MLRILTKLGLSLGSITSTLFVGQPLLVKDSLKRGKIEESKKKLDEIQNFEDIEIYAKENGCSFLFIGAWNEKRVYNAKTFLEKEKEKEKEKDWKLKLIEGVKKKKEDCKEGKSWVFAWNNGTSFEIKNQF